MKLSRQGACHTGHRCNQNCGFCFQRYCDDLERSYENCRDDIDFCVSHGDNNILLCGGEPTVSPHFFPLLEYMQDKPVLAGMVTNASRAANSDFAKKCADYGAVMAHVSVHSADGETQDRMTNTKGSWGRMIVGISNLRANDIVVRAYACLTNDNYKGVLELAQMVRDLGCGMLSISHFDTAVWPITQEDVMDEIKKIAPPQHESVPYIIEALDWCIERDFPVAVRMGNFCRYKGYERYLRNWMQTPWSPSECNPNTNSWVPYRGMLNTEYDLEYAMHVNHNLANFVLTTECQGCSMQYICGGIQRGLVNIDDKHLAPYEGDIIRKPLHFAGDTSWEEDWYKEKFNGSNAIYP